MVKKKAEEKTTRAAKKAIKARRKIEKKEKARILDKRRVISIYNKEVKEREKE